jgi:recombination protein RecA
MKALRKQHGEDIGEKGLELPERQRIPSGIAALDVATGGGLPMNRMTMVYGPESSCKTNIALCYIREAQKRWPDKVCVFIDIEGTLERTWVEQLGVDAEVLIVIKPDYAEQAIEAVEKFLVADDVAIVVVDSIAAMATMQELSKEAESESPGTQARAMGKMVRRATAALNQAQKQGFGGTLLWINQIRQKIGVMYGSPDTLPGGQGQKYMAAMRIKLYGKNVVDKKIHREMPCWKQITFTIEKWKCPITQSRGEFAMAMMPIKDLRVGQANDWPAMKRAMETLDLMEKTKAGVVAFGEKFRTQSDLWEWLRGNPTKMDELVGATVVALKEGSDLNSGTPGEE